MTNQNDPTVKKAMHVGAHAWHGFNNCRPIAEAARRIPTLGPILGLVVQAAGAVAGAAHGIKTLDD